MPNFHFDQHISNTFNRELEEMRTHMMKMGGIVEEQLNNAIQSLMDADSALAERVIKKDESVNSLEVNIDEDIITILARRQPAASDLRFVIAVSKTVNALERIGDHAAKVAAHSIELANKGALPKGYIEIRHIGEQVSAMVHKALDAFARLDVHAALEVMRADKAVDLEYGSALREMITTMMEDPRNIGRSMDVIWTLRSLERVGDYAQNIAENVIFLVKGKDVRHEQMEEIEVQVKGQP